MDFARRTVSGILLGELEWAPICIVARAWGNARGVFNGAVAHIEPWAACIERIRGLYRGYMGGAAYIGQIRG